MLTRIISGVVGVVLLLGIVIAGAIPLGVGVFILTLIGVNEFYRAVGNRGYRPVKIIGWISCLAILHLTFIESIQETLGVGREVILSAFIFVLLVILLSLIVFLHQKLNIIDIALTAFAPMYVVFLFSFVIQVRNLEHGAYLIWLVFIGAFATDTFAYFSGFFLGKRKLLPEISPKKTLEGSIGGIVGCILVSLVFGWFMNKGLASSNLQEFALYHFLLIGLLNGIVSQIGDWAASAIKRYVKVKDYGNLMPGHGGVLDRFDSILFTAPLVYFYFSIIL